MFKIGDRVITKDGSHAIVEEVDVKMISEPLYKIKLLDKGTSHLYLRLRLDKQYYRDKKLEEILK